MELFSLEEDDARALFITQTPSVQNDGSNLVGLLGDPKDFSSPCKSMVGKSKNNMMEFLDISDEEDFQIPSSQKLWNLTDKQDSYVQNLIKQNYVKFK